MALNELQLGHYRLSCLLGSGGMGEVYLAEDIHIMRHVAIKVIRSEVVPYPDVSAVREANRLFQREAKAIATLQHPHILPLFDYGEERVQEHTFTYMVMPYCQAGSLDTWLRQRENAYYLAPHDAAHIVEQAADALQYAHQQQIIHQDVKPSNFLIRGWKTQTIPDLVLADFGVAKFVSANSSTSQSIRGTPTYMAPEQWEGHNRTAVPAAGSLSHYPRTSQVRKVFIVLLLLLLIVAMSGALYFVIRAPFQNSSAQGATATTQAGATNSTATAQANANATHAAATAQANADATHVAATAQAQAVNGTATAQAAAYQNPYPPNTGTLALNDPLADNSKGYNWEEGVRDQGYYTFTGGSYHSSIPQNGTFHSCLASSPDFSDFAFEVQMNIISGNAGGIVFRASRATTHFYYFLVDRNGNYHLQVYYDSNGNYTALASGSTSPLHGNDLIGVVAQGSTIHLYVNRQLVQQVNDATYTHGQVGVFALSGEASFSNARVWTL